MNSNIQIVDKLRLNVLDRDGFRSGGTVLSKQGTSTQPFEAWDENFLDILGDSPSLVCLVEKADYAFAWEARRALRLMRPAKDLLKHY